MKAMGLIEADEPPVSSGAADRQFTQDTKVVPSSVRNRLFEGRSIEQDKPHSQMTQRSGVARAFNTQNIPRAAAAAKELMP